MTDHYLKAADKAAMDAALAVYHDEEGNLVPQTEDYFLDVVGTLVKPPVMEQTGTQTVFTYPNAGIDENGDWQNGDPVEVEVPVYTEVAPAQTLSGYHANLYIINGEVPESLLPLVLDPPPETPLRVRC